MPIQTAADILVAALKDPHDPRFCGKYLVGCLDAIFPRRNVTASSRTFLASNFDVWNTLARFISTKRSTKQMQRLLQRLSACTCKISDPNIAKLHDVGAIRSSALLERNSNLLVYLAIGEDTQDSNGAAISAMGSVFPVDVFQLLSTALQNSGIRKTAKGSSAWPTTPSDLIPLGPDAFVDAMIQWYNTLHDGVVFSVIGAALRLCRAVILPKLTSQEVCKYLVQCMRTTFDKVWFVWSKLDGEPPAGVDLKLGFLTQLEGVEPFLEVLQHQDLDAQATFVRGNETKLCQLCNLFLSVLTDPRFPATLSNHEVERSHTPLVFWSHKLYRLFHMHLASLMIPPRRNLPSHPTAVKLDQLAFPPPEDIRDPSPAAAMAIMTFKSDFRCCGKDCTSSLQSEGKGFQKCSGCGIAGYCGKACQLQDWRNTPYPHKTVCPLLRRLVAVAGGINLFGRDAFQMQVYTVLTAWARAGVKENDLKFVDDWARDRENRWNVMPNGEYWEPGYHDYEDFIWNFLGPKPQYPNCLARWPSEVAKVKALLEQLPFYDNQIDYHTAPVSGKIKALDLD